MKISEKKHYLILIVLGFLFFIKPAGQLFGQDYYQNPLVPRTPKVYLGLGLGINDYGLGILLEMPVTRTISLSGGVGIGGWGTKIGGGINIYADHVGRGSEFSLGYSQASGLKDFETTMAVNPGDKNQLVRLDLYTVSTINLIYTYNLKVGKSFKAGFSVGYAFCITESAYKLKTSGVTLTTASQQVLNMMQPGGLIIGMKFMFGI
jgi:hypothetical protein